jgi:hypothetical protein
VFLEKVLEENDPNLMNYREELEILLLNCYIYEEKYQLI